MNEQQVLQHLRTNIPDTLLLRNRGALGGLLGGILGRLGGGLGQKIIDVIGGLIGTSGFTLEAALAAAKTFYIEKTAGDNQSIPNWMESIIEAAGWWGIEWAIKRIFAANPIPTGPNTPSTPNPNAPFMP